MKLLSAKNKMQELFIFGNDGWADELLAGTLMTIGVATISFFLGIILGTLGALAKNGRFFLPRLIANIYTTIGRGFPELLIIYLFFFGGSSFFFFVSEMFGLGQQINADALIAGISCLAFIGGAYSTEIIRGAMDGISKGQLETADAFGMTPFQKFFNILVPQVPPAALPGLGNVWLVILKDTAFISITGLEELMRVTHVAAGSTHQPFLFYSVAIVVYLALSAVSTYGFSRAEDHYCRGRKQVATL